MRLTRFTLWELVIENGKRTDIAEAPLQAFVFLSIAVNFWEIGFASAVLQPIGARYTVMFLWH
jgi:hypothetical protein